MIEKIRIKSGGYFNSVDNLEINIYLQRENLIKTRWRNPIPRLKAYAYEINQLFPTQIPMPDTEITQKLLSLKLSTIFARITLISLF